MLDLTNDHRALGLADAFIVEHPSTKASHREVSRLVVISAKYCHAKEFDSLCET